MNISFAQITYIHYPSFLPPAKLWEGNVFTGVCHSVWEQRVLPRWDLDSYTPPPDMEPGYLPHSPGHGSWVPTHNWRPAQTCSLEDLPPPLPPVLTSSGGH